MNLMMNNPFVQIQQLMKAGKNPSSVLQMMAQNNPQARQVMQMMSGKTPAQLEQMARNMAMERGTTVEDIARSMGIQIPSSR